MIDDTTRRELRQAADIAGLSQEFAELLADAERYQWLRSRGPGATYRIGGVIYSDGGAGVDFAIDEAMAREPKT